MNSLTSAIPLDQPLPPDAIAGMTWGPFRYRRYPVFSWRWFMGRFWFAAVAVGLYSALILLGGLATTKPFHSIVAAASYFATGTMLMLTIGPALAMWVRHRHFPARREAVLIIAAVVLGFIGAVISDAWASPKIQSTLGADVPHAERKLSQVDAAAISLAGVGFVLLYFAFGGGFAAIAYFSERRRLRARSAHLAQLESEMRLTVLQAQIEPHFLFNALASIRPLIRQDEARAESAIDALASHLRATIPQMRGDAGTLRSTLGQQLALCAGYLDVMQIRMGSRLHYEIVTDESLNALPFPPLLLLSLVENAIKHGIEPKPGPGHITISTAATPSMLSVSVTDDGAGLQPGLSHGLGLANIREQLALRYQHKARLEVDPRPEGGTIARIFIPRSTPGTHA